MEDKITRDGVDGGRGSSSRAPNKITRDGVDGGRGSSSRAPESEGTPSEIPENVSALIKRALAQVVSPG
jgi:hypothetical protein